jgi:hypothetical protein
MDPKKEYDAWCDLVHELKASGAVTDNDCQMPVNTPALTVGQRIFKALEVWEKALTE